MNTTHAVCLFSLVRGRATDKLDLVAIGVIDIHSAAGENWMFNILHGTSIVDTPGLQTGEETMAPAGACFATIATPLAGECQKCGLTFR
jgi:hypothetical protein